MTYLKLCGRIIIYNSVGINLLACGGERLMFNPEVLSKNIKKCRMKLGLTQTELAEKLYVSGQAISKWESGLSVPDLANLTQLSDIFSTSVDKLIGHKIYTSEDKVVLGIDGGVTKTEFVLCTDDGYVINRLILDGCNPKVGGIERTYAILKSGIDTMLMTRSDISGVVAGISGIRSGDNLDKVNKFFETTYPILKISASSDINNVASCVMGIDKCAALICSAGFVVISNSNGKIRQIGGWGYLLDNVGGYAIGSEALRAVLAEKDGFGEHTVLSELVRNMLNGDVRENLDRIHLDGDGFVPGFAPLVFEAYTTGDKVASEILDRVSDQMVKILKYTLDNFDCGNNLIMTGGLIKNSRVLVDILSKKLGDSINIIVPELPNVFGACVRACREYCEMKDGFFENFKTTYI